MTTTFEDYDAAVRAFWAGRDLQTQKQIDSGKIDAGSRGSVTGGQHLGPLQDVIAEQLGLVRERLYDATCLVSTVKNAGIHDEPIPEVSTRNLTAAIAGRVAYIRGLL
jgi:hypothetical protein